MRAGALTLLAFLVLSFSSGKKELKLEWKAYWAEKNAMFKDSETSPLTEEDRKKFKKLKTFAFDEDYRVLAKFTALADTGSFGMKTSTERIPLYKTVGKLDFMVNGVEEVLFVYRNVELSKKKGFEDYLFIPFTDLSNFGKTYGGGRYLDLKGPIGTELVIDFNKAYNPYCAYSDRYSCPVPPIENHLEVEIKAGVLVFHKKDKY